MDLALKSEHRAFADEVREFARKNLSPATKAKASSGKHFSRDDHVVWQQALGKKGWLAYTWPKKFGGPGFDVTQRFLFENVLAEEGAPRIIPFGVKMVGPVIYTFGNDAQKERFLPGIRSSEVQWCQGYSEPGAGSDLANLRTRAVRDGDHYIVNGQKTWTSAAHWADWIFCLVRTNPEAKPQEGISFLLIDMKTPGITVRPIVMLDGHHHVNDVFFDNVKVPVANLIGKENEGWTCAKFLLANERLGIAEVPASKRGVRSLRELNDDPSLISSACTCRSMSAIFSLSDGSPSRESEASCHSERTPRLEPGTSAMPSRSLASRNLAQVQPSFSLPIRLTAGTFTLSKNTSFTW